MRPDVGIATLPQRLAGLRTLAPTAPAPAQGAAFADALAEQMGTAPGGAPAGGTGLPGTPGSAYGAGGFGPGGFGAGAGGFAPGGYGAAATGYAQAPALGAGVQLTGAPSLIAPQLPGAGGTPGPPAAPLVLDRSGPPPELQAYGNGRIPPQALESLGVGDHRLWAPAARAYRDLASAAARDGVTIGLNSSYRDLAGQQSMVDRYGLYSQGGRAAAPGSSNHGWGLSVDLQLDARAQEWMRQNGASYGFVEDVPREPWHWTFSASTY